MVASAELYSIDSIEEFIDLVYEKGWTDGLPVFPPTRKLVGEVIEYVGRDPDEIIGGIFPGDGQATIEKIAINCVMAGCLPEFVPVVIAAVEGLADPAFALNPLQSTGGPTIMSVVSGPAVKRLGFNTREWIFGGNGGRANATIGRAIRLILWNIGRARPGELLKGTMGQPAGWSYCIGEEQDLNPWPPFQVDLGFAPDASAVTLLKAGVHLPMTAASGFLALDETLTFLAKGLGRLGSSNDVEAATMGGKRSLLMVVNPSYAQLLADAGYTKRDFKIAMAERAVATTELELDSGVTIARSDKGAGNTRDESGRLRVIDDIDDLHVVVGGGWGAARSQCAVISGLSYVGVDLITKVVREVTAQP
jgi:hypothetical protein